MRSGWCICVTRLLKMPRLEISVSPTVTDRSRVSSPRITITEITSPTLEAITASMTSLGLLTIWPSMEVMTSPCSRTPLEGLSFRTAVTITPPSTPNSSALAGDNGLMATPMCGLV